MKKRFGETPKSLAQRVGSITIMVEMDFHVAQTSVAQFCERVEQLGAIPFLRKKERVLRGAAVAVGEPLSKSRIPFDPCRHARPFDDGIGGSVAGLKMIGDAEEDMGRAVLVPGRQATMQA